MILCIDIGNTNIVMGGFDGSDLVFESRIATERGKTEDQYAVAINSVIALYGRRPGDFTGAIVSSVVPPVTAPVKNAAGRLLGRKPLEVGSGMKTGLNIKVSSPGALGSDFVCSGVAAINKYTAPCMIFDLGTASKISAIDASCSFLGCSIMPGVGISLEALSANTAQLPFIGLDSALPPLMGVNSVEAMLSGVLLGTACMIDGMFERYREALGADTTAIITGEMAGAIMPHCRTLMILDRQLVLDGLRILYEKNI